MLELDCLLRLGEILDKRVGVADDAVDGLGAVGADGGHLVALRHDAVLARRRNHDRERQLLTEYFERGVDRADVDHHPAPQHRAPIRLEIALQRHVVLGAARGVVVHRLADVLRGNGHELVNVDRFHDLRVVLRRKCRSRRARDELLRQQRRRSRQQGERAQKLTAAAPAEALVAAHRGEHRLAGVQGGSFGGSLQTANEHL